MAKNNGYDPTDYARQQENIRKAKGNPNKNIHHKKKNSNYGGVQRAPKVSERMDTQRKRRESIFTMTPATWGVFLGLLAAMIVLMILSSTTYQGNRLVSFLSSLVTGATCCVLAYNGYRNRKRGVEATSFQTVLMILLAVLGVLYVAVGVMGLLGVVQL